MMPYKAEHQIYTSNLNPGFLLTDEKIVCGACHNEHNIIVHTLNWTRSQVIERYLCISCATKTKIDVVYRQCEKRKIIVLPQLPEDATLFVNWEPEYKNTKNNHTCFDIANKQIADETIKDKTILAGRESLQGATIGKIDYNELENKDKLLNFQDASTLLNDLRNMKSLTQ